VSGVLALVLLAHAVTATAWIDDMRRTFARGAYRAERILGFSGVDTDAVAGRLDVLLPPGAAVALAPPLAENDFFRQRLTEGLYPRTVSAEAPWTLAPSERGASRSARHLSEIVGHDLVVLGALPEPSAALRMDRPVPWSPPDTRPVLDGLRVLAALAGLVGLGIPLARWARGARRTTWFAL
jgi:hypothetical protein